MAIVLKLVKDAKPPPLKKHGAQEKAPFREDARKNAPPPLPSAAAVGQGRRILVVDDNPIVLKAFELKLKSDGFTVFTLGGAEGVASTAEEERVELIILDINFPPGGAMEWNGFTIMQWLRRFPELAGTPVILISGSDAAQYREKALQAGAVAFFQKPVLYKDLLATILQTFEAKK